MKIIIDKDTLAPAMKRLAKVASIKSPMQIMTHIAVEFDGHSVTFTANDGTRTYSATLDAKGDAGSCTLEAVKLGKAVASMKKGDITITVGQIQQGRSRIKLNHLSFSDFPQPDYENADKVASSSGPIIDAMRQVMHAMAKNDVRTFLNGVLLSDGWAVATDGHRMAWQPIEFTGRIIVPADSVPSILDMSGDVFVSENQLIISGNGERMATRLLGAQYPDWERVIPSETVAEVSANTEDLLQSLKQCQIGGEKVSLSVSGGTLTLTNEGAESDCECSATGDCESAYLIQYLIDAIVASDSETTELKFSGESRPTIVNGNAVVMPVRL